MSDVVEKTLTALPSLLSLDSQPGSAKLSSNSKLGNLIRGITELTSKHVSRSHKAHKSCDLICCCRISLLNCYVLPLKMCLSPVNVSHIVNYSAI
uniref:Uncharacterized protein n=1 Tax=Xiphophorus maculatus TaxID=8083 RepID=A0A3B5Q543_XIPMA